MRKKFHLFLAIGIFWGTGSFCNGGENKAKIDPIAAPWKVGEKLIFEIKWGIVPAGEGTLEVKEQTTLSLNTNDKRQTPVYHFVATAKSNSFLDVFYKVRDINESWLDTQEWVSHRFEQHNQEGKYILDQVVEYDWKNKHFKNLEKVKGREPKVEEGALTIPAVDTLSSLYLARSKSLRVGEEFSFDVHSGKNWPLVLKVLKRETVKVSAGSFDCFLVEPFLRERGIFIQKGKKMQVWITADQRQMPVLMKAEIFIGHVSAELKEFK